MSKDKKPSIYSDRGNIGSAEELDKYGIWVKSEPQDLPSDVIDTADSLSEAGFEEPDLVESEPEEKVSQAKVESSDFEEIDFGQESFNDDTPAAGDTADNDFDTSFDDFTVNEDTGEQETGPEAISFADDTPVEIESFDSLSESFTETKDKKPDVSTEILMKIAEELSSIRNELSTLKREFSQIRSASVEQKPEQKDEHGGFFQEEEDDKIALTGDELDNILNTADFTEEAGSAEKLESDFGISETETDTLGADEPDVSLDADLGVADDISLEAGSADESVSGEDGIAPVENMNPEEDIAISGEISLDDTGSEIDIKESPVVLEEETEEIKPDDQATGDQTSLDDIFDDFSEEDLAVGDIPAPEEIVIDDSSEEDLEGTGETGLDEISVLEDTFEEGGQEAEELKELEIEEEPVLDILDAPHEAGLEDADEISLDEIVALEDSFEEGGQEAEELKELEIEEEPVLDDLGVLQETGLEDVGDTNLDDSGMTEDIVLEPGPEYGELSEIEIDKDEIVLDDLGVPDEASPEEADDINLDDLGVPQETDLEGADEISIDDLVAFEPPEEGELNEIEIDKDEIVLDDLSVPQENPEEVGEINLDDLGSEEIGFEESLDAIGSPEDEVNIEDDLGELNEIDIGDIEEGMLDITDDIPEIELLDETKTPPELKEMMEEGVYPLTSAPDDTSYLEDESPEDLDMPDLENNSGKESPQDSFDALDEKDIGEQDYTVEKELARAPAQQPTGGFFQAAPESRETASVKAVPSSKGNLEIPVTLKNELKTVLTYMDRLLESLPEEKIEEFAKSEYFEAYKKLFQELGLV